MVLASKIVMALQKKLFSSKQKTMNWHQPAKNVIILIRRISFGKIFVCKMLKYVSTTCIVREWMTKEEKEYIFLERVSAMLDALALEIKSNGFRAKKKNRCNHSVHNARRQLVFVTHNRIKTHKQTQCTGGTFDVLVHLCFAVRSHKS